MKARTILEFCKTKNWKKIEIIFRNNTKHEFLVLASAVVETYHSDLETKKNLGLKRWDVWLDSHGKDLRGVARYNLRDFYNAWSLAENELKDYAVAEKIKDYISEHRKKLYNIFKKGRLELGEQLDLYTNLALLEFNHKMHRPWN